LRKEGIEVVLAELRAGKTLGGGRASARCGGGPPPPPPEKRGTPGKIAGHGKKGQGFPLDCGGGGESLGGEEGEPLI